MDLTKHQFPEVNGLAFSIFKTDKALLAEAKLPVSKSVCDHKHGSRIVFGERRCAKCGVLFGKM